MVPAVGRQHFILGFSLSLHVRKYKHTRTTVGLQIRKRIIYINPRYSIVSEVS